MWAEIPIDYDSGEFEDFLDAYRHEDDDRTHRWQTDDSKFKVIQFIYFRKYKNIKFKRVIKYLNFLELLSHVKNSHSILIFLYKYNP